MREQQIYRSKVFFTILFLTGIFAFVSDDDYRKSLYRPGVVRYNCDMLIGSWHPDVPQKVIDECRKNKNVKTY